MQFTVQCTVQYCIHTAHAFWRKLVFEDVGSVKLRVKARRFWIPSSSSLVCCTVLHCTPLQWPCKQFSFLRICITTLSFSTLFSTWQHPTSHPHWFIMVWLSHLSHQWWAKAYENWYEINILVHVQYNVLIGKVNAPSLGILFISKPGFLILIFQAEDQHLILPRCLLFYILDL